MPDYGSVALPAIVLAAGMSRRMGRNKLLLDLQGKPVLHWVLEALQCAGVSPIYVVTGHQADEVQACCDALPASSKTVFNPHYETGRASSIKAGLSALDDEVPGVLIMPGDVPFISTQLVMALQSEFARTNRICFPLVDGKKGHPVVFPRSAFPLLQGLEGDETLRDYMLSNPKHTAPLQWDDEACLLDVDTPTDLKTLRGKGGK